MVKAEYIWIDGAEPTSKLRSKTKQSMKLSKTSRKEKNKACIEQILILILSLVSILSVLRESKTKTTSLWSITPCKP